MSQSSFWYNGHVEQGDRITLSITDPGLLYGATHFTTLRIYHQSLSDPQTHWERHCQRLAQRPPYFTEPNWQSITQGAEYLSQYYDILRITLFPDGREWITGRSLPPDLIQRQTQGIRALLLSCDQSRSLPQFKTGNYLAPWLAMQTARDRNCAEAILTDEAGHWLETTTGNLWGYAKGTWYTPPLTSGISPDILPGIQRAVLIDRLKVQQQPVQELPWTPELVSQLENIAYSNCVVELIPIHTIITDSITLNYPVIPKPIDKVAALRNLSELPTVY